MILDATTGSIAVSAVVIVANGIGAAINNRRYGELRFTIAQAMGELRERVAVLEDWRKELSKEKVR